MVGYVQVKSAETHWQKTAPPTFERLAPVIPSLREIRGNTDARGHRPRIMVGSALDIGLLPLPPRAGNPEQIINKSWRFSGDTGLRSRAHVCHLYLSVLVMHLDLGV
jgi:hypothetical protein